MTSLTFPLTAAASIHHNLSRAILVERAVRGSEGQLASTGAFCAITGQHTGRSPKDKFVVRDNETDGQIWWDNAAAMTPAQFDLLFEDFAAFAKGRELYVQDLFAGADLGHRLPTRIFTEYAWHSLFISHLLRRPEPAELEGFAPEFTVVNLPSFKADPDRHGARTETIIACDFTRRLVLIGGTSYAGETKKSVFSFLNYLLPAKGVMPMHCSANVRHRKDNPVRRSLTHAPGRRRTRLVTRRYLQFRGWLLRQNDPSVCRC